MRVTRLAVVVGGIVVAAAVAGLAYATIPSSGGIIYACYDNSSGELRLYDPDADTIKSCGKKETSVFWSQTGPPGNEGPQGDPGAQGAPGLDGEPGIAELEWVTVNSDAIPPGEESYTVAYCPAGKRVISGGGRSVPVIPSHGVGGPILGSNPAGGGRSSEAWVVHVVNDKNWDIRVTVTAICGVVSGN